MSTGRTAAVLLSALGIPTIRQRIAHFKRYDFTNSFIRNYRRNNAKMAIKQYKTAKRLSTRSYSLRPSRSFPHEINCRDTVCTATTISDTAMNTVCINEIPRGTQNSQRTGNRIYITRIQLMGDVGGSGRNNGITYHLVRPNLAQDVPSLSDFTPTTGSTYDPRLGWTMMQGITGTGANPNYPSHDYRFSRPLCVIYNGTEDTPIKNAIYSTVVNYSGSPTTDVNYVVRIWYYTI